MSLSDEEILRLNRELHDLEEGRLGEAEVEKLGEWLRINEDARRYYVQRGVILAGLSGRAKEAQSAGSVMLMNDVKRSSKWLWLSVLAPVILIGFFIVFLSNKQDITLIAEEATDSGCAVLVDAVDAEWEGVNKLVGMPVAAGRLALKSGLARLEFYSGASMTLEGPCEVELLGVDEAKCLGGRLQVQVSPHARGFKLLTPDARVVDLGTEFGLVVDKSGKSEVHVFEGEVDVFPGYREQKVSLTTGKLWSDAAGEVMDGAKRSAFVDGHDMRSRSQESSLLRINAWREGMMRVMADPRLVLGYAFDPQSEGERTLLNGVPDAAEKTHGSIVGARWTQGRWPEKKALQFKSPGDRVRVQVDGEWPTITMCAWVAVDGYERRWNSLFLTDGFYPGNPHWQIENDGRVVLGVNRKKVGSIQDVFYAPALFNAGNMGVWYHLAVTFDLRSGVGRHYVNGRLVLEHVEKGIPPETMMRIGMAELGNWGQPKNRNAVSTEIRSFNGRMDEFLLFKEALGEAEIRELYEMGRPE